MQEIKTASIQKLTTGKDGGQDVLLVSLKEAYQSKPQYQRALKKEFDRCKDFDHQHLVKYLAMKDVEGLGTCIEMEWEDSRSLLEYLDEGHSEDEKKRVVGQIASALEYLHENGMVHGALDPAQIGDSTNADFLRSLGIRNFDVCLVTIGSNFQNSLETTSLLKELGAKFVVSRAERDVQAKFLLRNGADEVVYPEKQLARWAAIRYSSEHILDYIELQDDHAIMEVTIPPEWAGRSISELNIRKRYHINILALKRGGKLDMSITPDTVLSSEETMLVLGEYASIRKCFWL